MNFLFDLYGTLVDVHTDESEEIFWKKVAERLGDDAENAHLVKEEYAKLCKKESLGDMREFDLLRVFSAMLEKRGLDVRTASDFATFFREASRKKLLLFPHVKEILTGLKARGCGVYLLSNAQSCFTRRELDILGLTPLFDGILISSEAGYKKPSPKIFDLATEQFGIEKSDSIYVGNDLRDDVYGARGAGFRTAYVPTEQSGNYPELHVAPDFSAKDHSELRDLLLSLAENG